MRLRFDRDDLFVPFRDAPPIDYGLLWPKAGSNPLVRPFAEMVTELAT
ncbi:hypothetical protein ABZ319_20585 [Nocardia sp. NPDC005978]